MKGFVLILFCFLSLTCFGHSSNKHMICKEVGDVFGDVTNNEVHTRRLIGPRGNKGERISSRFNGETGNIYYNRVQEIFCFKVEEETRLLRVKVDKMETQLQELMSQISVLRCNEGVLHKGICYWAEFHLRGINYDTARGICSDKLSKLADINGNNHYDKLMNYLRGKLDQRSVIYVWTGMKKFYKDRKARLSDGSQAPYTRQRSYKISWEKADKSQTHVYLYVLRSPNGLDQGIGALQPTGHTHGALCQTV